jgi:CheY-like chemotaxis protein
MVQAVQKRGEAEILSVDDDPMNHMVLRNILKQTSYRVIEADCGEQALQILQERYESGKLDALPSLILMDVMMPGLNGFQTTERIRELFPEALLPIIMISATASEDSICRGFRAGCNDYISKPIKVIHPSDLHCLC